MAKSVDFEEIKQKTAEFSRRWQKKLNYLSKSVKHSGKDGFLLWLKSHNQIEELEAALEELVAASKDESFKLIQVETTLSSFVLPEEDAGQADWYRGAGNYLDAFEDALINKNTFDKTKLAAAANELKFISQADDFHQRYGLTSIQEEVKVVYNSLQQALTDYKKVQHEKIALEKEQEKIKLAELEAEKSKAEAKKLALQNLKIKEKRMAIIEDRKRQQAEQELAESQAKHQVENAEILAKQAEAERQAKLQDAYVDLQLEERIKGWQSTEVLNILKAKLEEQGATPELIIQLGELESQLSG